MSDNNELRIIKKYPNRRLYDTAISSYITLEDVKRLVLEEVPIKVINANSQEDITYNTLLQIIMESEEKGPSLFSTSSLEQMIRFYGNSMQEMQKMFRAMLEQSMTFMGNPTKQADMFKSTESLQQWQKMMGTWMTQMTPKWPTNPPSSSDQKTDADTDTDKPGKHTSSTHHR